MDYDVIVIGAGVGGLFSALKVSRCGKKVLLLEDRPQPGGYAATFQRKGFTFEASLHCVDGLGYGQVIREYLEESGIAPELEFIDLKSFARLVYPGHEFIADFDLGHYVQQLKKEFPHEARSMDALFGRFRRFSREFDAFSDSKMPQWLRLCVSPLAYRSVIAMSMATVAGQLAGIKDQRLAGILMDNWRFLALPPSRLSAFYFFIVFQGYYAEPTAYVRGGYGRIFEAVVSRLRQLGSTVQYNTRVTKILTDAGEKVRGVVTEQGQEYYAKTVISNVNVLDTLGAMLDDEPQRSFYRNKTAFLEKSISVFQVYLGLNVPAKSLGMDHYMLFVNTTYDHEQNFRYNLAGDFQKCSLGIVDHAQVDPSLAPPGKGTLLIMAYDTYGRWKGLAPAEYKEKKRICAEQLVRRAGQYLPGLHEAIEVIEAATPMTMERYTHSPEGAVYGFAQTVGQAALNRFPQQTRVPGLFLAGAWTFPGGGVHGCFYSGMCAADLALRYVARKGL